MVLAQTIALCVTAAGVLGGLILWSYKLVSSSFRSSAKRVMLEEIKPELDKFSQVVSKAAEDQQKESKLTYIASGVTLMGMGLLTGYTWSRINNDSK